MSGANQTTTYGYDTTNRLISVSQLDGMVVACTFDAQGQRTQQSVTPSGGSASVVNDTYEGGLLQYQTNGAGTLLATYTYDAKGVPVSVRVGSDPNSSPQYYIAKPFTSGFVHRPAIWASRLFEPGRESSSLNFLEEQDSKDVRVMWDRLLIVLGLITGAVAIAQLSWLFGVSLLARRHVEATSATQRRWYIVANVLLIVGALGFIGNGLLLESHGGGLLGAFGFLCGFIYGLIIALTQPRNHVT